MGLADLFKAGENQQLKQRISDLEAMLTPELRDIDAARQTLSKIQDDIAEAKKEKAALSLDLANISADIKLAKENLVETNEAVLMQEFGLYEPKYDFANADLYKAKLLEIRARQKELIKAKTAVTGNTNWTVNNSAAQGRKMLSDMQKLLLRAFNNECDEVIGKIKFNNIDSGVKRITNTCDAISKLGSVLSISISPQYYRLKIEELYLAYEYQLKKEEEKESLRQAREEMREQAKLQKEIEAERKRIAKDKTHYLNALEQAQKRLETETNEARRADLEEKVSLYQTQLTILDEDLKAVDYRESNHRAGYVYIISNIGAFGENIYKIGMTRRLEPTDRIDELGDASVPFKFDIHALIFAEDAPALETALHHAFEGKKVNMVNNRREFFNVSLDEIKQVVKENFDKTVEFVDVPDAEQYRQTLLLKKQNPALV